MCLISLLTNGQIHKKVPTNSLASKSKKGETAKELQEYNSLRQGILDFKRRLALSLSDTEDTHKKLRLGRLHKGNVSVVYSHTSVLHKSNSTGHCQCGSGKSSSVAVFSFTFISSSSLLYFTPTFSSMGWSRVRSGNWSWPYFFHKGLFIMSGNSLGFYKSCGVLVS